MKADTNSFAFNRHGFTLIELLTVIAIIGILAAIIIPTTQIVRVAAKKAQTRSMFSEWSNAYSLFKQEYGFYPDIADANNKIATADDTLRFVQALTAKEINGTTNAANLRGNKRRLQFYSFSDKELPRDTRLLTDPFGNTEFGVVIDKNRDGVITFNEQGGLPAVRPALGGSNFTPTSGSDTAHIPTDGVRAGVIFYSAGKDGSAGNAVMSWK
jgi:prepilin-type N-terminal cleavage/methylation domain-containing protein